MRRLIFFACAAVIACAPKDQRPAVRNATSPVAATDSIIPLPEWHPASPAWAPPPGEPGDTTPQGFPTEHALLRWVRRLPLDSFPELPNAVRGSLASRGCTIPTPSGAHDNVITGAFTGKGAIEWAVLCSVRDTSQILIVNATSGAVVDSLNRSSDSQWIQGNGNNTWLFSRLIALVPMSRLSIVPTDTTAEDVLYYGAVLPKPIDHDGIDEAFLEKASTTFYFAQKKWFEVGSSD